jgi:hypothetical protein
MCRDLVLRHYPGIRLEELTETKKTLNQDTSPASRVLDPGPPEYEARV